ncbi:MAG: ferrous iron transport protein B [Provencibacterium sp.]|jgi:ferrous iron transport protein B|nr:ferrous iron transport protein B [Provencibacterium sp.]
MLKAALCGNPNCGKTTLYNRLTGQRQPVGNWAGVTVDKAEGVLRTAGGELLLLDLPGVYSLSAFSMEEEAARRILLEEEPAVLINIVDGTNLERNLYLSLQLLELRRPMVIAVNMMDEIQRQGGKLDCALLGKALGVPVLPVSARSGEGVEALCAAVFRLARQGKTPPAPVYDPAAGGALREIGRLIDGACRTLHYPALFYAARLLGGEKAAARELGLPAGTADKIEEISKRCAAPFGGNQAALLAGARYRLIDAAVDRALQRGSRRREWSERIDALLLHRLLALPIFLGMMGAVFSLTFGPVGRTLKGGLEALTAWTGDFALRRLAAAGAPGWIQSLLTDAVIGGVGGVLAFLPQILLLFLFLSLLEDSGYMARAAFMMDRLLRGLGLSGKSFIPMLMGFGCTTPAIMATRALDNERDRQLTILLLPFMSCGARLPIYALFSSVFFPGREGITVFSMYLLGMAVAVLCGLCLKKATLHQEDALFLMELPPYRIPTLNNTLLHMWEKGKGFLWKAGTVIFSMNVVLWLLQHLTPGLQPVQDPSESLFGAFGRLISPLLRPLGFGEWQPAVALLAGLIAKESVVSTLSMLYGAANMEALSAAIASHFTPLSALSFMTFCLLYMPCISAFVTLCRELGSIRKGILAAWFQTGVAYAVSFLVYSFGLLSSLNR